MASIGQNLATDALPDFRNLGVIARTLLITNVLALAGAVFAAPTLAGAIERFVHSAAFVEPLLIVSLLALFALSAPLRGLPYATGCALVVAIVLILATLLSYFPAGETADTPLVLARTLLLTFFVVAVLLAYFRLFARAFSPALAEARLQALQARIRPHFLFNSLNAVLALIRTEPRRAERTLEDLADLFRALMSDARRFVRLADELTLLERYAAIERLRLGERLRVVWETDEAPMDALVPSLLLQPLLENAVYHGVEPLTGPGEVTVRIARQGERVTIEIGNPVPHAGTDRPGNRLALDNIRERLLLFFDAEARIETAAQGDRYKVTLELPYVTEQSDVRLKAGATGATGAPGERR